MLPFILDDTKNLKEPNMADYINTAIANAEGASVLPISLPTGNWVIIREQNGDDDSIISNVALQKDASSINLFVAAIVAYSPKAKSPNGILTLGEVLAMTIRDKYVIIIKSRIFSMGKTLEFTYTWNDQPTNPVTYEEDLTRYIWDYTTPFPLTAEHLDYDPERVAPYKVTEVGDGWLYFNTLGAVSDSPSPTKLSTDASTKHLRFKLLNGYAERKLLALGESGMNINTKIMVRELQLLIGSDWHKVESFKPFKPADMAIIRKTISDYDHEFEGNTEVENSTTGDIQIIPLMSIPSFFFPQGI